MVDDGPMHVCQIWRPSPCSCSFGLSYADGHHSLSFFLSPSRARARTAIYTCALLSDLLCDVVAIEFLLHLVFFPSLWFMNSDHPFISVSLRYANERVFITCKVNYPIVSLIPESFLTFLSFNIIKLAFRALLFVIFYIVHILRKYKCKSFCR